MPIITLDAILLIFIIIIVCKLFRTIFEICEAIALAIKEAWEKFFKKKRSEKPVQDTTPLYDTYERVESTPANHTSGRERFGISGKCDICGNNFSPVNSSSENHLARVNIDFYGKSRTKLLCGNCRQLMLEDRNCSLKDK